MSFCRLRMDYLEGRVLYACEESGRGRTIAQLNGAPYTAIKWPNNCLLNLLRNRKWRLCDIDHMVVVSPPMDFDSALEAVLNSAAQNRCMMSDWFQL